MSCNLKKSSGRLVSLAPIVRTVLFGAIGVSVLGFGPAVAQSPVTIKVATGQPTTNYLEAESTQFWMKRVNELAPNAIKFEYYPAGQLGKPEKMLDLLEAGASDVTSILSAYTGDKLPLVSLVELPGLYQNSCRGTAAYKTLLTPGKVIFDTDFKDRKLKILYAVLQPQNELSTAKKQINTASDVEGLKLRVAGGGASQIVTALGGAPVRMAAPEIYQSFSRGTVDGVLVPWNAVISYDLHSIAKYTSSGFGFGGSVVIWTMNARAWNALPANVQKLVDQASADTEAHFCKWLDDDIATERQVLEKRGLKIVDFDAAAKATFVARTAPIVDNWVKDLESRGKPAGKALAEFQAALTNP